jgi:hypothetical protein
MIHAPAAISQQRVSNPRANAGWPRLTPHRDDRNTQQPISLPELRPSANEVVVSGISALVETGHNVNELK